jgi:WD repeat-containing protein 45
MATPATALAPPNPNLVSGVPPSLLLQQQQEEEVLEPVLEMAPTPLTTSIGPTPSDGEESDDSSSVWSTPSSTPTPIPAPAPSPAAPSPAAKDSLHISPY